MTAAEKKAFDDFVQYVVEHMVVEASEQSDDWREFYWHVYRIHPLCKHLYYGCLSSWGV